MRATLLVASAVLAGALVASAGCANRAPAIAAPASTPTGELVVVASAVPLFPDEPSRETLGAFHYAGGIALSAESPDLHGLSALVLHDDNRLIAVGDLGILFSGRVVLDAAGRLVSVADARLAPLVGEDGRPLVDKSLADAEGLARMPDGTLLVSFEGRHRILLYPASGAAPRQVVSPDERFPENGGMEALTAGSSANRARYLVGGEESGQTWTCEIDGACVAGPVVDKEPAFGLTAMVRLPDGGMAYLLRAYDPQQGTRVALSIVGAAGEVDRLELTPPMTVDNFEGLAAVARPGGVIRFYLLSDDNASAAQRTLLLAFDWRPDGGARR